MSEPVREPINIDPVVKEDLNRFLTRPDVPRGLGFSAFISYAIREASNMLAGCEEDGSLQCMMHFSPFDEETSTCELHDIFMEDLAYAQREQATRDGDRAREVARA